MPNWIEGLQGFREILNSGGTAQPRRKQVQFLDGFTVSDDGTVNTVAADGAALIGQSGVAAAVAAAVVGQGLRVDSSDNLAVENRLNTIAWQDDFLGGGGTSGNIGAMGWHILGVGSPTYARIGGSLNGGKGTITAGATTNNTAVLCLGSALDLQVAQSSQIRRLQSVVTLDAVADRSMFFGLSDDFADTPTAMANGIGVYFDETVSPNWHVIARDGSTGSGVDTGIEAAAGTHLLSFWQPTPGTVEFRLGETSLGSIASGISSTAGNLGLRYENLGTGGTIDLGVRGVLLESHPLTGPRSEDTFTE